jgi:hypothetical protein
VTVLKYDTVVLASNESYTPVRRVEEAQREGAARYVASRARRLGWSRQEHETVLLALFEPSHVLRKGKAPHGGVQESDERRDDGS